MVVPEVPLLKLIVALAELLVTEAPLLISASIASKAALSLVTSSASELAMLGF